MSATTGSNIDFDCRCATWKLRPVAADVRASFCTICLGWLKRPTIGGLQIEQTRLQFLRSERPENDEPRGPATSGPAVPHKGGRPRLRGGCSKGHASWAWVKRGDRRVCRLCDRERARSSRKNPLRNPCNAWDRRGQKRVSGPSHVGAHVTQNRKPAMSPRTSERPGRAPGPTPLPTATSPKPIPSR